MKYIFGFIFDIIVMLCNIFILFIPMDPNLRLIILGSISLIRICYNLISLHYEVYQHEIKIKRLEEKML